MKYSIRYKPVGWRQESYRHSLASKGVRTNKVDPRMNTERFYGKKRESNFTEAEQLELDIMEGKISEQEYYKGLVELQKKENEKRESESKGKKQRMAYVPTYGAGDLAPIAGDAVGTAGAAAVPLIPLAVTAGIVYGGVKYAKYESDKYKKKKKKKSNK